MLKLFLSLVLFLMALWLMVVVVVVVVVVRYYAFCDHLSSFFLLIVYLSWTKH